MTGHGFAVARTINCETKLERGEKTTSMVGRHKSKGGSVHRLIYGFLHLKQAVRAGIRVVWLHPVPS